MRYFMILFRPTDEQQSDLVAILDGLVFGNPGNYIGVVDGNVPIWLEGSEELNIQDDLDIVGGV